MKERMCGDSGPIAQIAEGGWMHRSKMAVSDSHRKQENKRSTHFELDTALLDWEADLGYGLSKLKGPSR